MPDVTNLEQNESLDNDVTIIQLNDPQPEQLSTTKTTLDENQQPVETTTTETVDAQRHNGRFNLPTELQVGDHVEVPIIVNDVTVAKFVYDVTLAAQDGYKIQGLVKFEVVEMR
jgi:methionine-rich copper-binding protein CopC